jgi:gamma-glutamylaminecyclotransferase
LHDVALAGVRRLALVRTVRRFPMFVAAPWFAPMMLDQPGIGHQVTGELYEVDDARLARIDALESVGKPATSALSLRSKHSVATAGVGLSPT